MKTYKCICGREFTDSQVFNNHKANCKQHIEAKYGDWASYKEICKAGHEHVAQKISETASNKRNSKLIAWISESHTCEKCGIIMTEKYGSGRFCSKKCANSHTRSPESRKKTSESLKKIGPRGAALKSHLLHTNNHSSVSDKHTLLHFSCKICGKEFKEGSYRKTCSDQCRREAFRQNALSRNFGGPSKVSSYGKKGIYKGIHCDSTYELAFLIYCLDHNIDIIRNETFIEYELEGVVRKYYPDFYLPEYNLYIETKGRDIGPVYEKLEGAKSKGYEVKLLHYEDLIPCFEYVCATYNVYANKSNNTLDTLYDKE